MKLHAKVIVNPAAGANSTRRKWPGIADLLKGGGLSFDYEFTQAKGHAIEIAREAAGDGYRYLVAVGGDGTVHEVANGIMATANADKTALGIVCTGTGSDLSRSVGISRDFARVCSSFTTPRTRKIDIGLVRYRSEGRARERYFINSAGIGFDATVVAATEKLPKYFGGTVPYLVGLIRSFVGYRNKTATFRIGNRPPEKARILSMVVANGGFFGGGMHIAPEARLDDELFDVVIIGDFGKLELLKVFPRVYKGSHLTYPKIRLVRDTRVSIESNETFLLHADGELLGQGPVDFSLLPHALNLMT
jgi:diacylglycerol kinase (ATP)